MNTGYQTEDLLETEESATFGLPYCKDVCIGVKDILITSGKKNIDVHKNPLVCITFALVDKVLFLYFFFGFTFLSSENFSTLKMIDWKLIPRIRGIQTETD